MRLPDKRRLRLEERGVKLSIAANRSEMATPTRWKQRGRVVRNRNRLEKKVADGNTAFSGRQYRGKASPVRTHHSRAGGRHNRPAPLLRRSCDALHVIGVFVSNDDGFD